MARIPQYTAQQSTGGGAGARSTAVAQVIDLSGPMRAAGAFEEASRNLARHQEVMSEKLAQDEAAVHATNTMSQAGAMWQERIAKAQTEAPAGGAGFTVGLLKDFDGWAEETQKNAPERAKRLLQQDFARFRQGLHAEAFRFEVSSRNAKLVSDNETGIDADARLMTLAPEQATDVLARRLAAIQALDLPAPARDKLAASARERVTYFAGLTLAGRNPQEWLQRDPTKDPVKSLMDPRQMSSIDEHARATIKQAQSHALAGREAEVKAAQTDFEELHKFVARGGMVSPEYEQGNEMQRFARMPGMADAAAALVKQSRAGAAYGALPLADQRRALALVPAGSPDEAKHKEFLAGVTRHQEAAYKENPWSAATQYGRAPDSPPVKLAAAEQIPMLIDERLKTIGRVEVMASSPVSPIRPEEVQDVARLIQALPPLQQGEIVGRIGAKLNVQQIAKMAEQVDKTDRVLALQMMAGADRTTAGVAVASRIRQGATAIRDKQVKRDDAVLSGWRAEIATMIGDAIPDQTERASAIDAAYYVRAAMDVEGYDFKKSNEDAVNIVVGGIYERQGIKTLAPRGMPIKDFEAKVGAYTAERLAAMAPKFYIRGKEVPPQTVANRLGEMALRRTGAGGYVPFHNGAAVTLDPAGTQLLTIEVR